MSTYCCYTDYKHYPEYIFKIKQSIVNCKCVAYEHTLTYNYVSFECEDVASFSVSVYDIDHHSFVHLLWRILTCLVCIFCQMADMMQSSYPQQSYCSTPFPFCECTIQLCVGSWKNHVVYIMLKGIPVLQCLLHICIKAERPYNRKGKKHSCLFDVMGEWDVEIEL